ncbi:YveK family protein [Cohnella sp. 56]|uniref:YveK family protein n=1 Tax=Cohnella sp. 56 TaxID=3113722 RepID=UPI0030E86539
MGLKGPLLTLQKYFWFMLAVVTIASSWSAYRSYTSYTPLYRTSAQILINSNQSINGLNKIDLYNLSASLLLMNSYKEIILSETILQKVIKLNPDLNMNIKQFKRHLSVSSQPDSQVMTIMAVHQDPNVAAKLCNDIAKTFQQNIRNIMNTNDGFTLLTTEDHGYTVVNIAASPYLNVMLAFLLSSTITVGLVLLKYFLDNSIRNEADLSGTLGLNVLGAIPDIRASGRR